MLQYMDKMLTCYSGNCQKSSLRMLVNCYNITIIRSILEILFLHFVYLCVIKWKGNRSFWVKLKMKVFCLSLTHKFTHSESRLIDLEFQFTFSLLCNLLQFHFFSLSCILKWRRVLVVFMVKNLTSSFFLGILRKFLKQIMICVHFLILMTNTVMLLGLAGVVNHVTASELFYVLTMMAFFVLDFREHLEDGKLTLPRWKESKNLRWVTGFASGPLLQLPSTV